MAANARSRCWQFTVNNYERLSQETIDDVKRRLSAAKYWVIGEETAPSTGTPHWQGFIWTHNAVRFGTIQDMLAGTGAHITRGDNKAFNQMEYCKKEGKFMEYGEPPVSQKRKGEQGAEAQKAKWRRIWDLAYDGKLEEIAEENPQVAIVHINKIKEVSMLKIGNKKDLDDVCGEWFVGKSGTRKSTTARRENPGAYIKGINKWWCGYKGQDVVILEDVSPKHDFLGDFLKIWADMFAFTSERKGGTYNDIRPKKFIVTSQYDIEDIWLDQETRDALNRRFKVRRFPEVPRVEERPVALAETVIISDDEEEDEEESKQEVNEDELSDYEIELRREKNLRDLWDEEI